MNLVKAISALMFRHDPIQLNVGLNADEYESQACDLVELLPICDEASKVTDLMHEIFQAWFTKSVAGERSRYDALGQEVWHLYSMQSFAVH